MSDIEALPQDVKQQVVEDAKIQSLLKNTNRIRTRVILPLTLNDDQRQIAAAANEEATLDALVVTNVMQPLDVGDGQPNALNIENQAYGLEMTIPAPAGLAPEEHYVQFLINGREVGEPQDVDLRNAANWPVSFFLDSDWFTNSHGQFVITYKVVRWSDANVNSSLPAFYWVDTRNPSMGSPPGVLTAPDDLPQPNTVTIEYLNSHDGIELKLPALLGYKPEDTFSVEWDGVEVITNAPITRMPPFTFKVRKAVVEARGPGVKTVTFKAKDRAGNETTSSSPLNLNVVLTSAPGPLPKPRIPESPVSLEDSLDGVLVFVDPYPNAIEGDRIQVNYNGSLLRTFDYPADNVVVPYNIVALYGTEYTARISYRILRGNTTSPESDFESVPVDLSVIGPPNPDFPPSLVNPDLPLASLLATGGTENTLTPAEKGKDATVTVPLYPGAEVGHVIRVFYNDTTDLVETLVELTQDDLDAGEITRTLSSAVIDRIGNGNIPLFYRIYKNATVENYQQSLDQPVVVTVNNLSALPVATFPQAILTVRPPIPMLNCSIFSATSIAKGNITVRLSYASFSNGDKITLYWVMHNVRGRLSDGNTGTFIPPTSPVESTRREFLYDVTPTDVSNKASEITVLWGAPHLANVVDGAIEVYWRLVKAGNITGTSLSAYANVSREKPGQVICIPS